MLRPFILLFLLALAGAAFSQEPTATVAGHVMDDFTNQGIELVTVYVDGTNRVTETDPKGDYRLEVDAEKTFTLVFTRIGYTEERRKINVLKANNTLVLDVQMTPKASDVEIVVTDRRVNDNGMIREDVSELKLLPTTTGNLESVLPHIALGANSGTGGELSSQYNVRGGNYDENLVYVNDFEIYRPQLVRAGQQEGLTFPNIDLIRSLSFSSGGFEARYGDKQSSVLDIQYKRPDSLRASASVSALGATGHLEGTLQLGKASYQKLRYLVGARYKTTRYLLGTLDIQGEYLPDFTDIQAYVTYDLHPHWQLGVIGNYNRSAYRFRPQTRSTAFGLIDFALELFAVFEGQEVDDFTTNLTGVSLTYLPERNHNPYFLKLLASRYQSAENERFDITGYYSLREIDSNLGSDNFGEVLSELGAGTQQQYVRNYLFASVTNVEQKGGYELQVDARDPEVTSSHFLQWSAKWQNEWIDDQLNEWERLDSAGYSLPYDTSEVFVYRVLKKDLNPLSSNRLMAYAQDTYTWRKDSVADLRITAGLRAAYWDLNGESFVTPRVQLLFKPLWKGRTVTYRLAGGLYYQPPFYRELRNPEGQINTNVLAQKSAHIVGGMTWDFYLGKLSPKKFRFITEVYYKWLWDQVSYDIENVRIRYSGQNDATGYVTGIDFRLNGEFVPGAESWFNLSFLRAREHLDGIQHLRREYGEPAAVPVDDVPRPTDQFMTLSVFFQDYLPKNENFKMHLNFTVGTGLPYGLLDNNRVYRNTYRFSPYHRVDIGFSVLLWNEARKAERPHHFLRFTRNTWLSLEIFNLMKVQNVASNTWIKTIFNQQYAIPNYLTSRRVNLRVRMDF
ncbi:MAG: TonB-dependent receptor [Lewinellaceae bacterium]|nr:TonB-dependent receptor [Lewinellaceae bacterium]